MKNYTTNSGVVGGNDQLVMADETRDASNEKDEPANEKRPDDISRTKRAQCRR